MNPAGSGTLGQLGFVTECDVALIGESFDGFLARYVALIEAGALACVPVAGQSYTHEVIPADAASRGVYAQRWDSLFDPRKPPKKTRPKKQG